MQSHRFKESLQTNLSNTYLFNLIQFPLKEKKSVYCKPLFLYRDLHYRLDFRPTLEAINTLPTVSDNLEI